MTTLSTDGERGYQIKTAEQNFTTDRNGNSNIHNKVKGGWPKPHPDRRRWGELFGVGDKNMQGRERNKK